jgi:hypothetical protein
MFTIASAPAKQSATETISVLASRLNTSPQIEIRRGAVYSLRSLAKQFPASVASEALRGLIADLSKDGEDVDTVKVRHFLIPLTCFILTYFKGCT